MSPSLFDPTPVPPAPDTPPPAQPDTGRPPPRSRRPARSTALMLALAAAVGGGTGAGAVLLSGVTDAATPAVTTVAQTSATNGRIDAGASATALDAPALYAATAPGVVDITARATSGVASDGSAFGDPSAGRGTATGTGFVIDADGHVVTAAHVIDGASSITLTFQDGTTRTAQVLGRDDATDVAVLKVDASGLTLHPLELGSSASLQVGEAVAAVGDPFGYARSISTGIVSGLDRTIDAPNGFTVAHAIQTDAALNPGNSGGPVLNAAGQVIGIADQIATNGASGTNSGVGFAVPIDLVKSELAQLKAGRPVSHAYLGVSTSPAGAGALVQQVVSGSPADQAGIRAGDTVTAIDSTPIKGSGDLVAAIAAHASGDRVTLTVKRGSDTTKATVTLAAQPSRSATQ
jgi:putative serine protease PepD